MAKLSEIDLDTSENTISRNHYALAIDMNKNQELSSGIISTIEIELEKELNKYGITGWHLTHLFDENVDSEYPKETQ